MCKLCRMEDTSVSLLERLVAKSCDEDWQRLLSIYRPFIDGQVRKYPQLRDEAEDIVQNICMVLMRELPSFERQRTGSFRKWLRQVVVNQLRIGARKQRARPIPSSAVGELDLALDQLLDQPARPRGGGMKNTIRRYCVECWISSSARPILRIGKSFSCMF